MGEMLIIETTIFDANILFRTIKDPDQLFWDWGPEQLDVAARWLPKKGFKILPKLFDANYKPGNVGDEGDRLITRVRGCYLRTEGAELISVWCEQVLELQETKDELRKFIEGNILDMSFEEEVVKDMEKWHGKGEAYYTADGENLRSDNKNLKSLGEILLKLAECMDKVKQEQDGVSPFFEFYIP